jgi:cobalt-zinc-cadmium efflux system outer membrane protein
VLSLSLLYGDPGTITEAGIVQDVIGLLSLSVRKKIAGAQADRVIAQASQRVLDLAAQVKAQYYTVVGDAQAVELAGQVVESTGAAAELARRQLQAGNLSRREQAMQQAFHAQNALELAQAQARLAMDREKLNELMGLWGADTQWSVPQRLPELPRTLPALASVEETAVSQRLDLEAARKEAEAAAQALHLTRQFRFLSSLGLGVAYKREPDGEKFFGPEIELGLPIFNQGQGRIARAQAESASAAAGVAAMAVEIRAQARTARAQVMAASDSVRHYERALLPLQQSIVEETLKFYNGMLVGPYDLLLAQQSQVQTAGRYIEAKKAFWHAWVDLERALGGRVELPDSAHETSEPVPADAPALHPHAHE